MKTQLRLVLGSALVLCLGLAFTCQAADKLTEDVVKQHVKRQQDMDSNKNLVSITFESVQFGKSRTANKADEYEGIPHGETIYPVRVKYTTRRKWSDGEQEGKFYYEYGFFKNAYGEWDAKGYGPVH